MNIQEAKTKLMKLIERYNAHNKDDSFMTNEKQACQSLIVPLLHEILHWHTDDPSEFKTEVSQTGKRIAYFGFRAYIQGEIWNRIHGFWENQ